MKFALLILDNEKAVTTATRAEREQLTQDHGRFAAELAAAGKRLGGSRLRPSAEAIRFRGDGAVLDGPFAEAKEVLGGFYLIECETKEEAVAWAKKCPKLPGDTVELRQVWEPS